MCVSADGFATAWVCLCSVDRLADGVAGVHLAPPATPPKAGASLLTLRSPPKRLDGVEVQPGADPWLLQRLRLQEKVLHSGTRVLITAPPAAGKTSLIQLLAQHPRVSHAKLLHLSTLGARQKLHEAGHPADLASVEPLSAQEVADWWPLVLQQPEDAALAHWDYIFIDDAQLLYGVTSFWARVLKHPGRTAIFFFASTAMESLMLNTPAVPAKVRTRVLLGCTCTVVASARALLADISVFALCCTHLRLGGRISASALRRKMT